MVATKHELEIRAYVKDQVTQQLKRVRTEVEKTTGATTAAGKATQSQSVAMAGLSKKLLGVAAAYVGVHQAIGLVTRSYAEMSRVASRSQEIRSAFGFTFGDEATETKQDILAIASATGRFSDDLLDAATSFQLMLEPLIGSREEASKLSTAMVQLGVDLGSFRDVAPDEALARLQSFLAGNSEALRQFVGFIGEEQIKAEAFRLGLAQDGQDIDQATKLIARSSVVVNVLGAALGDAERTTDSFANTMVRFHARISEVNRELGDQLNTSLLEFIDAAGGAEGAANVTSGPKQLLADIADGALIAAGYLLEQREKLVAGLEDQRRRMQELDRPGVTPRSAMEGFLPADPDSWMPPEMVEAAKEAERSAEAARLAREQESGILGKMNALIRELADKDKERLETIKEQTRQQQAATFGGSLAEMQRRLDLDLASTAGERIRIETAINTAAINTVRTKAEELGIAESIAGDLDRYRDTMEEVQRLRNQDILAQESAARIAEERRAEEEAIADAIERHNLLLRGTRGVAGDLAGSFGDLTRGANTFADALENSLANLVSMVAEAALLRVAFSVLTDGFGIEKAAVASFFGIDGSAKGNVFSGGEVVPFADGGVPQGFINGPAIFPLSGGRVGVAGEAGSEVGLGVTRNRSGKLVVDSNGGGGGLSIAPGAIVVVQQPGQSGEQLAQVLMNELLRNPTLRRSLGLTGVS